MALEVTWKRGDTKEPSDSHRDGREPGQLEFIDTMWDDRTATYDIVPVKRDENPAVGLTCA